MKTNQTSTRRRSRHRGFSLVELLVVIAVIGIIASIAIPSLSSIFGESKTAKNQRNAQNIVSLYNSARSSGATGINTASKATIISALMGGVSVSDVSSPFNGKRFSIGTMDSTSITDVQPFIRLSGDVLEYIADGGQGSSSAPVATNPNPWVLSIGNIASESIAISYRDAYTRSYGSIEEFRVVAESNGTWKIESRRLA